MNHHAYFVTGETEQGIERARSFVENTLGLPTTGNPDVIIFRHTLFSVDDARALAEFASRASIGERKALIVSVTRLFHEAQNVLLKLFEEPTEGTFLILVIPSEGDLITTLRSRLIPLPGQGKETLSEPARAFIDATPAVREKMVEKILDRLKSEKDEEKQKVRREVLELVEGIARVAYAEFQKEPKEEYRLLLDDLNRFIPILHERSPALKLILEHISLVLPRGFKNS